MTARWSVPVCVGRLLSHLLGCGYCYHTVYLTMAFSDRLILLDYILYFKMYFHFTWTAERWRGRKIFHLLVHLSNVLRSQRWTWGQSQELWNLCRVSYIERQGPKHLSHLLLPPRVHISRRLELEVGILLKPQHSNMDAGVLSGIHCARCPSQPSCILNFHGHLNREECLSKRKL